ncbi:MAG: hypothetical protein AAF939_16835 [Planctomycetota bacterium]
MKFENQGVALGWNITALQAEIASRMGQHILAPGNNAWGFDCLTKRSLVAGDISPFQG